MTVVCIGHKLTGQLSSQVVDIFQV